MQNHLKPLGEGALTDAAGLIETDTTGAPTYTTEASTDIAGAPTDTTGALTNTTGALIHPTGTLTHTTGALIHPTGGLTDTANIPTNRHIDQHSDSGSRDFHERVICVSVIAPCST